MNVLCSMMLESLFNLYKTLYEMKKLLLFAGLLILVGSVNGQEYTGFYRTSSGNTNYHHFTRNNAGGAAVYINQVAATGPILRLSSGTATANSNVKFTVENNGNVGIGTSDPIEKLSVLGAIALSQNLFFSHSSTRNWYKIENKGWNVGMDYRHFTSHTFTTSGGVIKMLKNGNLGIGTITPTQKLSITDGQLYFGNSLPNQVETGRIRFSEHNGTTYQGAYIHYDGSTNKFHLGVHNNNDATTSSDHNAISIMRSNGNVGIGTTTIPSGYKLAVAGKIITEQVRVENQEDWPDYVFETGYNLSSLEEVADFIQENKHLPGIPSANEVKENGINLGDMDAKLLQKVEELTLYIIEQQKLIENLQTKFEQLENK